MKFRNNYDDYDFREGGGHLIAQLVSALDLVTSSVQVEGSILTAGKRLSLKNLNVIIRAIN